MMSGELYKDLHKDLIVIDGLIISKWNREVFEDMRKGGITAANCTCSIWEGINESLINLAKWKSWFKEYSDLIIQVNEIEDILYAKKTGGKIVLRIEDTDQSRKVDNAVESLISTFEKLNIIATNKKANFFIIYKLLFNYLSCSTHHHRWSFQNF